MTKQEISNCKHELCKLMKKYDVVISYDDYAKEIVVKHVNNWTGLHDDIIASKSPLFSDDKFIALYSDEISGVSITSLSDEEVWALRKEITLNSIYTSDYQNSFGIDTHEVQSFFEGLLESLEYDEKEGLFEWVDRVVTPESVADYRNNLEA